MTSEIEKIASIIESLLFIADKPLPLKRLREIVHVKDITLLKEAIAKLEADYAQGSRGIYIKEIGGGLQLRTKAENSQWILELNKARPQRLSRAALETLAIIAYKQPLTRQEVEEIRGVDCGGVMKTLLEKDLIKIMGKKDEAGNPLIYGTTEGFLSFFGIKALKELPSLREYAEIKQSESELPLEEFARRNDSEDDPEATEIEEKRVHTADSAMEDNEPSQDVVEEAVLDSMDVESETMQ